MGHRRTALALTLALAGFAPSVARAQLLPATVTVDKLPNGLTIVVIPFDSPGVLAYDTLVRTGSRDEIEAGHSGFAHLFEHMMFRGSEHFTSEEYEHRVQLQGADNNAFTTEDFTFYTLSAPSTALDSLAEVEADRFQHLSYTEAVFRTETQAVLGEYNKNSANPVEPMWEVLSEIGFQRHTYGHTTMGYIADINAMPGYYTYAQQFFHRFYTPDNCTIIVAGDVTRDRVLPLVTRLYSGWTGHRDQPVIPPEPATRGPFRTNLVWSSETSPRMLMGWKIPGFTLSNTDAAALDVVHALVFSTSSPLYQKLVVQDQSLLEFGSWKGDYHRDPGFFTVEGRLASTATFDAIERLVQDTLTEIGNGKLEEAQFRDVVSNLRYEMPMSLQTPSDVAGKLGRFIELTGETDALDRFHAQFSTLTVADVVRVVKTYLIPARRYTVTLSAPGHAPTGAIAVGPGVPRRRVTPTAAPRTATPRTATPARGPR